MKNILQPFLIKTKIFLNAKKGPISPQIWPLILFLGLDLKILNWNWEYFIKMLRLQILWYVRSALVITNVQLIPKHESWNERSFFINLYQNWMEFWVYYSDNCRISDPYPQILIIKFTCKSKNLHKHRVTTILGIAFLYPKTLEIGVLPQNELINLSPFSSSNL